MEILTLKKQDIKTALTLVWAVFEEFEVPDYSKEGVEEFRKFISYDSIIEKFDRGALRFWGCFDEGDLVGVIATRDISHICLMFVKKEYHRQGVARKLFQTVEEWCKSQHNSSKITVNSSPYAVKVYHRLGFVDTDKEQTMNGIRYTPMSYLLN